jgi:hypothetical protein
MLDPAKTRERHELLKRICELDREIAEGQPGMWEFEKSLAARLPLDEQFEFYLNEYLRCIKYT